MTKKDIARSISDRAGITVSQALQVVQGVFDEIIDTLATEGRIELRNFGVFEVRERKARKARNPRTGDPVEVQPKNVVTFQPGKEMEERVRHLKNVPERPKAPRRSRGADHTTDHANEAPFFL